MKCPHCYKHLHITDEVYRNVRNFGTGSYRFRCNRCDKLVNIESKVSITFDSPTKVIEEE